MAIVFRSCESLPGPAETGRQDEMHASLMLPVDSFQPVETATRAVSRVTALTPFNSQSDCLALTSRQVPIP